MRYRARPDSGGVRTDEEAFESFQRQWRERNDPRPFLITGLGSKSRSAAAEYKGDYRSAGDDARRRWRAYNRRWLTKQTAAVGGEGASALYAR